MQLLKTGEVSVTPSSSDDQGTTFYTLNVSLVPSEYASHTEHQSLLESNILDSLDLLFKSIQSEKFERVAIVPKLIVEPVVTSADPAVVESLMEELVLQKGLMIAVATGGPRINAVNQEYKDRHQRISEALAHLGLKNPVPFDDLWKWYEPDSGRCPITLHEEHMYRSLSMIR